MNDADLRLIHTTVETPRQGYRLARRLVEERLAACVSVAEEPVTSFYRWEGSVEETREHVVRVKTRRGCLRAAMRLLREHHPYDCPEVVAVEVRHADPDYAAWVIEGTTSSGEAPEDSE